MSSIIANDYFTCIIFNFIHSQDDDDATEAGEHGGEEWMQVGFISFLVEENAPFFCTFIVFFFYSAFFKTYFG